VTLRPSEILFPRSQIYSTVFRPFRHGAHSRSNAFASPGPHPSDSRRCCLAWLTRAAQEAGERPPRQHVQTGQRRRGKCMVPPGVSAGNACQSAGGTAGARSNLHLPCCGFTHHAPWPLLFSPGLANESRREHKSLVRSACQTGRQPF
jgi:hypothetical protein